MISSLVKLKDVATIIAGQSPAGKNYNNNGEGMPFYQGKKDYGDKFLNPPKVWTKSVTKVAIEGDILLSVRAPVGALNIATEEICIGRGLAAIRGHEEINKDYLFYVLSQISIALKGNAGAIFNSINKTQIENIEFLLPPLAEQERIVAKLDTAFAEIDKIATNTQQKLEEAQKLYASGITDIYFSNKSVPVVPLSKIAKIKGGKRLPKGKKLQPEPTNYPYIRVSDFTDYGTIDEKSIKYITEEIHSEISRYTISSDDVYISIAGTIGKTGIIPQSLDGANLTENAAKIMLDEECDKDYFYFFTTSSSFEKQAIAQTRTTAQPKLALGRLEAVELPIHNKLSQLY